MPIKAGNVIPKMTSNTAPSGVASASSVFSSVYEPWYAFNQISDQGWASSGTATAQWLCYKFTNPVAISQYTISSRNSGTSSDLLQSPKNWRFEASNDGSTWTKIDERDNVTNWGVAEKRVFTFNNNVRFLYYRIYCISNNGSTTAFAINELEMMEYDFLSKFLISSEDTTYSFYQKVGKPLVPLMDGYDNAIGSVIGSASYSTGYTWKAFDNDDTTVYTTNFTPNSSKPVYIGYRFNDPVCAKRYSFLAGLRTFKFMASNNGTTWDTLDTQTALVSNTTTYQTFDIKNEKKYFYYKIEATLATSGNDWINIHYVQFYGLTPSVLVISSLNENNFVNHGIDKAFSIDTNEKLSVREHKKQDSTPLGSGRVFKQKIDRSKHRAKKIILG